MERARLPGYIWKIAAASYADIRARILASDKKCGSDLYSTRHIRAAEPAPSSCPEMLMFDSCGFEAEEPLPDPLAKAREAFLNLIAEARRWDEDTDGEYDEGGARTWTFYFAEINDTHLRELVEALGIPLEERELSGAAIERALKADGFRTPAVAS